MSPRRNLIAVISLVVLLALAFPLLASLFSEWLATSPEVPATLPPTQAAAATVPSTPTVRSTSTGTATDTATPTATSTLTPLPSDTPTTTPTPTATPTATATPSPTARPRVYLQPFVQVFAVGQPQPNNSSQVLMYEGGNDIFEVVATQGTFSELQTPDGKMSFWTASNNLSASLPLAAVYDYNVRGQTAALRPGNLFACAYNSNPTLAFGACQTLTGVTSATLIARITAGSNPPLYLASLPGGQYLIPSSAIGP